ncbi:MAG: hypothetical protein FWE60_00890, partial [Oscillospiraceae bacterium]|nr:hypothetical protein [Oscillospiraceae bacterium]
AADGKLEAFLKEIVALLSDHENRIVVYCASKQTVDYVSKALWACNGGKRGICVYGQSDADSEYIYGELSDTAGSEEPRIIVADDSAGVKFLNVEKVTHIINYEYPENPAVLEQRFTRGGRKAGNPAFYIFCDEADRFDGRMLRNVVLSNIGLALGGAIPDKCLLFDIEGVEERLAALILELKYIIDTSKDAKADAVAGFRAEFNAPEADSAAKMAEVAKGRLQKLIELFDLHGSFKAKEIDGEKLFIQLTEKAAAFKGKRVFLDEKGALKLAAGDEPPKKAKPSEAANAAAVAKKLTGGEKDFSIIKSEIEKLSDSQKLSVLISIWKHYKYVKKLPKSYKSFIELYNKGVI